VGEETVGFSPFFVLFWHRCRQVVEKSGEKLKTQPLVDKIPSGNGGGKLTKAV
jgi:hypothetical protein